MNNFGEQFLHQKDQKLHASQPVEHEKTRLERKGEEVSSKPADKISDWLEVLEKTHMGHKDDPGVLERIKNHYHREHVIEEEGVPESAFLLEQKIARERGHGTIEITDEFKKEKSQEIISNQKQSLDKWVDYLSSSDATYPVWAKHWAFKSMLNMGRFEKQEDKESGKETAQFKKRTKDTVASFPPLNARALAMTISAISAKAEENSKNKKERITPENVSVKLNDEEFKALLTTESFSKLYAQFLMEMPEYSTEGLEETRGEWIVYKKGSGPDKLVESLDGHPLEWCTANIDTARTQLQGGDFYVYYSFNEAGEAKIPRVAISMEEDCIGDVRGIAPDQNVDPYINDVVEEKMTEFPDGEQYKKKTSDMKLLTEIEEKNSKGEELSKDDLSFLYQTDSKIDGFGYSKDPRIEEIIKTRDIKSDLSLVTGFNEDEIAIAKDGISITIEDGFVIGKTKYCYGDLDLTNFTSAEGLVLPEVVSGDINLYALKSAKGLVLPKITRGNINLNSITSAEGLTLPKIMDGGISLDGLTSAEGLTLPGTINGDLALGSITSDEGLVLPERMNGTLDLSSLASSKGLVLPETMNGGLNLDSFTSAEGLILPKIMNGYLNLDNLRSTEGLTLPDTINDKLTLNGLTSAKGLILPETMNGYLDLRLIRSAEDLVLPKTINGTLNLYYLGSAEGLTLPEIINGDLILDSLASTEGFVPPETIKGDIHLKGLNPDAIKKFKGEYPNLKIVTV
jgi:hypothetical protein